MLFKRALLLCVLVLVVAPVSHRAEANAQGCSESYCYKTRQSTGDCDVPALKGCNCACDDPL